MNKMPDSSITRRGFLGTAAAGATAAALPYVPFAARAAEDEIVLFSWESYDEDPWLEEWSKSTGVRVNVTRFGSIDELFAKARTGAVVPDLMIIDTSEFSHFRQQDLIVPMDIAKVPNAKNISPAINFDKTNVLDGKLYAVPYNWGPNPMMYRADHVTEGRDTWMTMWDPKYAGRVGVLDDAYSTFELLGIVCGAKDPYNLTDADFDKCADLLRRLRPQVKTLLKGANDTESLFTSGDLDVGFCQAVTSVENARKAGRDVRYSIPKEGAPSWMDNAVITRKGDRPIVYDFINHRLSLPWQKRFVELSAMPGVLDTKTAKAAGLSQEVIGKTYMDLLDQPNFWSGLKLVQAQNDLDRRLQMFNDFKAGVL